MRRHHAVLATSIVLSLLAPAASRADGSSLLYLLASDSSYTYWSSVATDPELASTSITRHCSFPPVYGTPRSGGCLSGVQPTGFIHSLFFGPAALVDEDIVWNSSNRPRFRLALAVESPAPFTVHLLVQGGDTFAESAAAVEVSSGVYEGEVAGTAIDARRTTMLGVRVRSTLPHVSMTLATAGGSYLDFRRPIPVRSVPELIAADSAPAPAVFQTEHRRFEFNDDDYRVHEFAGDFGQTRSFSVRLTEPTPVVYAWVESFVDPHLKHLIETGEEDERRRGDSASIRLFLDDLQVTRGAANTNTIGRGMESVAAVAVGPGTLRMEVAPGVRSTGAPYTARIITAGPRSIARMQWSFTHVEDEPLVSHRSPSSGYCASASEPVPASGAVTTFSARLGWETANALPEKWTLRYSLPDVGAFACGEGGTGDRVRFTVPPDARVWGLGAVPARDAIFASDRLTTFTFDVRLTYAPR